MAWRGSGGGGSGALRLYQRCAREALAATGLSAPTRDAIRKAVRDATPAAGREFGAGEADGSFPRLADLLDSPDAAINAASTVGDGTAASPHRKVVLLCLRWTGPVRGGTAAGGGAPAIHRDAPALRLPAGVHA